MTPAEALAYLHQLSQFGFQPGLDSTRRLAAAVGNPQDRLRFIHVAGTNGKTSVTRMIDALLTAFHRRTGRTTSPHLQMATERISIDGRPVSPRTYVDTYNEIAPFVEMIDAQSEAAGGPRMSKFEVVTAMAFAAFAEAPVISRWRRLLAELKPAGRI